MTGQAKAVIIFDDGMRIYVQSTVEQIRDEIPQLSSARIPLIKVVDEDGADLWINADHIRAFDRGGSVPLEEGGVVHDIEGVETNRRGRLPFRLGRQDRDR